MGGYYNFSNIKGILCINPKPQGRSVYFTLKKMIISYRTIIGQINDKISEISLNFLVHIYLFYTFLSYVIWILISVCYHFLKTVLTDITGPSSY